MRGGVKQFVFHQPARSALKFGGMAPASQCHKTSVYLLMNRVTARATEWMCNWGGAKRYLKTALIVLSERRGI